MSRMNSHLEKYQRQAQISHVRSEETQSANGLTMHNVIAAIRRTDVRAIHVDQIYGRNYADYLIRNSMHDID